MLALTPLYFKAFKNFSRRSGLFPSWQKIFSPTVCLSENFFKCYSKFQWLNPSPPTQVRKGILMTKISLTTLRIFIKTLYVNTFRNKPAITNFEWTFTPNHQSSQNNATFLSTALPVLIPFGLLIIRSVGFGCYKNNNNKIRQL